MRDSVSIIVSRRSVLEKDITLIAAIVAGQALDYLRFAGSKIFSKPDQDISPRDNILGVPLYRSI